MKIGLVHIWGGLGNQMFQFAFMLGLKKNKRVLLLADTGFYSFSNDHNGYELKRVFKLRVKVIPNILFRILRRIGVIFDFQEKEDGVFCPDVYAMKRSIVYYKGYWQSELYFKEIKGELFKQFVFCTEKLSDKSLKLLEEIRGTLSVSIHIRRGDYLKSKDNIDLFGGICNLEYYNRAIAYIENLNSDLVFNYFVFSDDIEWAKMNLTNKRISFIDWNKGKDDWQDMYLISQCKNNIIANSTFSWWGAWLNSNPDKIVIAPKKWLNNKNTNDLIPIDWIKI